MISELANLYAEFTEMKGQQKHDKNRITYVNQLVIDLEKRLVERLDIHTETFTALLERIEKLERKSILPTEKRLTEILREQLHNHDVEVRFIGCIKDEVPSRLNYLSSEQAMNYFFKGYKLTRDVWDYDEEHNNSYIKLGDKESVHLDHYDFLYDDWYVL